MKGIINNWHNISVYVAGAIFLIVAFFVDNQLQMVLLLSAAVLFLHFFAPITPGAPLLTDSSFHFPPGAANVSRDREGYKLQLWLPELVGGEGNPSCGKVCSCSFFFFFFVPALLTLMVECTFL